MAQNKSDTYQSSTLKRVKSIIRSLQSYGNLCCALSFVHHFLLSAVPIIQKKYIKK